MLNRAVARLTIFEKPEDYDEAFLRVAVRGEKSPDPFLSPDRGAANSLDMPARAGKLRLFLRAFPLIVRPAGRVFQSVATTVRKGVVMSARRQTGGGGQSGLTGGRRRWPSCFHEYRRLAAPERLELRATPGGSLLEILLGVPIWSPLMGWSRADENALIDGVLPALAARKKERLTALAELRQDSQSLGAVMGELRTLLDIASADRQVAEAYLETARQRIEHVADSIHAGGDDLDSDAFRADLWWVDELFASMARAVGQASSLPSVGQVANLPDGSLALDSGGGMSTMDYDGGYYPPNMPPVAQDDGYYTMHDTPISVSAPGVMWNDYDPYYDPLTASLVSGPSHAASFTFNSDGSFDYMPEYHFAGSDSFTYRVSDGEYTDDAVVSLYFYNSPPVAEADNYYTAHDTPITVYMRDELPYFESVDDKGARADATCLFVEPLRLNTRITLDAAADDVAKLLRMVVLSPADDLDASSDSLAFPPEWFAALEWELAKRAAPSFSAPWGQMHEANWNNATGIARQANPRGFQGGFRSQDPDEDTGTL